MKKVYIDGQSDPFWGEDDWKEFVAGDQFDERFVIFGNHHMNEYCNATWFKRVYDIWDRLDDITMDYDGDKEAICEEFDLEGDQLEKLYDIQNQVRHADDFYVKALRVLYPNDAFVKRTIRGSSQGEWQYAIARDTDEDWCKIGLHLLQEVYFGNVSAVYTEDGYWNVELNEDLWDKHNEGKLKEHVIDLLGLDPNEEIKIYYANGYIQTTKWEEI